MIVPVQAAQGEVEEVEEQQQQHQPAANGTLPTDPAKFSGKKSKAAAKQGTATTQYGILRDNGIPVDDIPLFRCALPSDMIIMPTQHSMQVACLFG